MTEARILGQDNIIKIEANNLKSNDLSDKLLVTQIKTIKQELASFDELIKGYDTIKIIIFSYSLSFLESIIDKFKYIELIIGADFIYQNDSDLNDLEAIVLGCAKYTNTEIAKLAKKYPKILEKLKSKDLVIRISRIITDHRKLYLLSNSTNDKTRVITGSANLSFGAWGGSQMENIYYDDTELSYEIHSHQFETAMDNSSDITYDTLLADTDDYVSSNPILADKKTKIVNTLFANIYDKENFNKRIDYVIELNKESEIYNQLLKKTKVIRKSDGMRVLEPKLIKSFTKQQNKFKATIISNNIETMPYPSLKFDFSNDVILYNNEPLIIPDTENIKSDIDVLFMIFKNFDNFIGDIDNLKATHFKLLNAMFCSPFHAPMRCIADSYNRVTMAMPLWLTIASSTASCGKTFMTKAIMHMMTGKSIEPFNGSKQASTDDIEKYQKCVSGFPVVIDELKSFQYIGNDLKDSTICEKFGLKNMPMCVFTTNSIVNPDEAYRKRMIDLQLTARFPSNEDETKARAKAEVILSKLSSAFYRAYLIKMFDLVKSEIDYMIGDVPDGYYPDLLNLSSKVLIDMFKEYGYDIPSYINELKYSIDYSVNSPETYQRTIKEIDDYYIKNKSAFIFTNNKIKIFLGNDEKQAKSWVNSLPSECMAEKVSDRTGIFIIINKKDFLERSSIHKGWIYKLTNKLSRKDLYVK
jgi:hypothetical protein